MKKYLLFVVLFTFCKTSSAQFVTLADTNFRNYIAQNIDQNAIVGNKLDTTNINVISLKTLEIYFFNNLIEDLDGIKYFDSLEVLKISYLNLTQLAELPPLLKQLVAVGNQFQSLPAIPQTLTYLDVSYNELDSIGELPQGLTVLLAAFNDLDALPDLPDSLLLLNAPGNDIHYVNQFPQKLSEISLWDNDLDSIPSLPQSLRILNVSDNDISSLPVIPDSLQTLYISFNELTEFPELPQTLTYLDCARTISCLPLLPESLVHLNFDGCLSNKPAALLDYYPTCRASITFCEIPDAFCNDTLKVDTSYSSFLWNTGATTSFLPDICRDVYTVTVTDSLGCIYNTEIDITDTVVDADMVLNTELSCMEVGMCGYVADVTVKGGTPPYRYKWSGANGEIDFSVTADSTEDLIHFCLSDVTSSEILKCVITDASGQQDSVIKQVYDNLPPEPFYVDIVNPVCSGYPTGYIYMEDDPFQPGGNIFIMETSLDAGQYIYSVPFGNGCEQTYTIDLDYQFSDCANMYTYNITDPDTGMCNGSFELIDNVDHGIYNLGNTEIAFDGMYLFDGTSVASTDLCLNTWYYFFVYDFNIGYFVSDSIYISAPLYSIVYPGDVNSDGIANNMDVLALGIALNESGYARVDNTTTWGPKSVQNWMHYFSDSTNMAHADCDGNGLVQEADAGAIQQNYGLLHSRGVTPVFITGLPVLYIELPDTVQSGAQFDVPVILGDSVVTADSVQGIAFTLSYDSALVDAGSVYFTPDSCWLGELNSDMLFVSKKFTSGINDVGITRTNHESRSGYGVIGRLHIKAALVQDTTTLNVSSTNITAVNESSVYFPVNGFADQTVILPTSCLLQVSLEGSNGCNSLYGGSAFAIVQNSSGGVNYNWSTPLGSELPVTFDTLSNTQDSLPSALYQVVVIDSSGCRDTARVNVQSEDGSLLFSELQNPTCPQLCDGWIWLKTDSVNGPSFTSVWNNGQTNAIHTGLCKGVHWVTLRWATTCTRTDTFQLKEPMHMNYNLALDSASCNLCDGSAVVSVNGGRRPYQYDWQSVNDASFLSTDSVASNLCFNRNYTFIVTDACGDNMSSSFIFDECDSVASVVDVVNKTTTFTIAPNPNNGSFVIILNNETIEEYDVQVFNAQGSIFYREYVEGDDRHRINMGAIPQGLYICTVTGKNGISSIPFVVN